MVKKAQHGMISQLNQYIDTLCGLYSRVAKKLGVDRSFVSRVARGERRSEKVEKALIAEFKEVEKSTA